MEGSLLILPGTGIITLGTYLAQSERRWIAYRVWAFILTAIGVGALWSLSQVGGIGGPSGHSIWWGLMILPYPVAWCMSIWGPESSRWTLWLGTVLVFGIWRYLS